jgi:hypothetical protein
MARAALNGSSAGIIVNRLQLEKLVDDDGFVVESQALSINHHAREQNRCKSFRRPARIFTKTVES